MLISVKTIKKWNKLVKINAYSKRHGVYFWNINRLFYKYNFLKFGNKDSIKDLEN
jgi:hypothetical protein